MGTRTGKVTQITSGPYAGEYGPGFVVGVTKPGHCGHNKKIGECVVCWPEEPTVTAGDREETIETHPAYGHIAAARVSGHARLYGSDFRHQHYMVITIRRSQLRRSLSRDWHHEREELIEVALSESQWATFVSSLNGGGSPCTLTRVAGAQVSPIAGAVTDRGTQFTGELRERLSGALDALKDLRARVAAGKGGKESVRLVERAEQQIVANLEFVVDQFGAHVEKMTEKAKAEVLAFMDAEVSRAGIEAIKGRQPLRLEEPTC